MLCPLRAGGAVAMLCTLRLLRALPDHPTPALRCLVFATPAVRSPAELLPLLRSKAKCPGMSGSALFPCFTCNSYI